MSSGKAYITKLASKIARITRDLENEDVTLSEDSREELIKTAEKLAIASRKPEENLYFQATQTAQNFAIRTAIGMGVFEKVPPSGDGIGARELASLLDVEELLLSKLFESTTKGPSHSSIIHQHYVHNEFSATFLVQSNRDMFQQIYDFVGRAIYTMPYYLESNGYQNPTDYNNSPFQYGHDTNLGLFDYLNQDPERMRLFNSGMKSAAAVGKGVTGAGPYPFDTELDHEDIGDEGVLIVDVGGGRGHMLEAIKEAYPKLKGRMVLQDVSDVIQDAKSSGLPSFIEGMAASFFEPQPIQGASIYYFRRIFHDWSDEASLTILKHTRRAMDAHSRILIVDTVVPTKGAPRYIALQDIHMMSFGGMERTRSQWEDLLNKAGLKIKKLWAAKEGFQRAIEAVPIPDVLG